MILELLLNNQMIRMSVKILMSTIQEKKRKVFIAFNDLIADMISNKKLDPIVTKLFIRGRKLNILPVVITKSHFKGLKILG